MISDGQIKQIVDYISKIIPSAEFIDHGFDGVVFQYDEHILKVFPDEEKANAEIIGFQEIARLAPSLALNVHSYGYLGQFYALIRDDIWNADGFAEEIDARGFTRLIEKKSEEVARKILMGEDVFTLVQTECDKFRADNDISEENGLFTNDLFMLAVNMHLNGTPLNDISLDNIGISSQDGELKIRDMSRFETYEKVDFSKPLSLLTLKPETLCAITP